MSNIFDIFKKIEAQQASTGPISYMIVGLGNPGKDYEITRHNAGFLCIDYIAAKTSTQINRAKFSALVGEATIGGVRCLLVKPQTFMNLSGRAVLEASDFYKIPPEKILVLSDDVNLDVGRMRLRAKGSAGGQKGLENIILRLGSEDFPRLRMGVGKKPHPDFDMKDWVLSEFSKQDQKMIYSCFETAYEGIIKLVNGKFEDAQMQCNSHTYKE
ncbi:MAG: aminoacyl-tRNA hydrolase [Clostridia bacterium]|nr:aminoacyl-tRNA hydrolase [Clostridia bacterium]